MNILSVNEFDIVNYKKSSMFIICPKCSFKCDKESGISVCQNSVLAKEKATYMDDNKIVDLYMNNPLTHAIVFGGLEPLDSFDELIQLLKVFRSKTQDDIVIYTGYKEEEVINSKKLDALKELSPIIIKYGRFIPNCKKIYDQNLGVTLASDNQYSKKY